MTPAIATEAKRRTPPRGAGYAVQIGGGLVDFSRGEMRTVTDTGGYWDLRVVGGMNQLFALEAAYIGSAHAVTAAPVREGAMLIGHGGEANVRLNVAWRRDRAFIIPFVFGGLGYTRYAITGAALDGDGLALRDDVAMVPVGGGFAIGDRSMFLDVRFTQRFTFNDDLLRMPGTPDHHLRQWSFGANLGYAF